MRVLNLAPKLAAVALAAAATLLALPAADESPLQAQSVVCEKGNCEEGGGGSSCTSEMEGGIKTCETTGGCQCTRVERSWWFDTQVCTPTLAVSAPPADARVLDYRGSDIALRRVGPDHFAAAAQCGADDWTFLARELPNGEFAVTTNPLVIRLRRWAHGLAFAQ